MLALGLTTGIAVLLGLLIPLKRLFTMFLLGVLGLWLVQFGITMLVGAGGYPSGDVLLLFEGQVLYYLWFLADHATRLFAVPVVVFGALMMSRIQRDRIG